MGNKKMKRYVFNMKRVRAGYYETVDGLYYVVRSKTDDGKRIYWTAGKRINNQNEVMEDFAKYSHARNYLMQINLHTKEGK
jgi:hypothetical protein